MVIDTLASTANVDVTPDVSPESPVATEAETGDASTSTASVTFTETGDKSTPTSATPTESSKARKRKRSKVDDVMDGVARQLLQSVEKNDQRMIELEEKRMKLEERQMERELQAKREERDFQMKLMQMMMSSSPYMPPHVHMASQSTRPVHSLSRQPFTPAADMYNFEQVSIDDSDEN